MLKWLMAKEKMGLVDRIISLTTDQLYAISESTFQKWVMEDAKTKGWHRFHALPTKIRPGRYVTAQMGETGFPDIVLTRANADGSSRLIFLELKKMSGQSSEEQDEWIRLLTMVPGVEAHIYKPTDAPKIARMLE